MKQAKFAYSPWGKAFEKQTKTIEKQGEKQTKAIEKKVFSQIKNQLFLCFQKIF